MQVRITDDGIDVLDAALLTGLSAITDLDVDSAVAALVATGIAHPGRGGIEHVWFDVAELARLAAPDDVPGWQVKYDAMIDYAASKGWTDADRSFVRAHLEVIS